MGRGKKRGGVIWERTGEGRNGKREGMLRLDTRGEEKRGEDGNARRARWVLSKDGIGRGVKG